MQWYVPAFARIELVVQGQEASSTDASNWLTAPASLNALPRQLNANPLGVWAIFADGHLG